MATNTRPEFILLYDGQCPICRKEVAWLRNRNRLGKLGFQDISAENFDISAYSATYQDLMAEIHGVYPDRRIVKGMPAFRAAYRAVGLGWLLAPTGWPVLEPLFDWLYSVFARHRIRLSGMFGARPCRNGRCERPKT